MTTSADVREYIDAARLTGRKNLDGRLAVTAAAGLPFLLQEGMQVHLVPPVIDAPRTVEVLSVSMQGPSSGVVAFSGIGDADVADMVVGCHCLLDKDAIEPEVLAEALSGPEAPFSGWTFEDVASGKSGRVTGVQNMPSQVLLTVAVDGEGGERLVPLVDDFVVRRDDDAMRLVLDLPIGIFDL